MTLSAFASVGVFLGITLFEVAVGMYAVRRAYRLYIRDEVSRVDSARRLAAADSARQAHEQMMRPRRFWRRKYKPLTVPYVEYTRDEWMAENSHSGVPFSAIPMWRGASLFVFINMVTAVLILVLHPLFN